MKPKSMFNKILIANRGEIACRVIRTARRLGIRTVAVYSEADSNALHVESADEAIALGGVSAQESYLRADRVLEAARRTGAQAIHPGYGFLSENATFSRDCEAAGLVFVGPPAAAIDMMGSKSRAKQRMEEVGVPILPGYHGDEQTVERFTREAEAMGYPVLLKAAAGGGGKGMRRVDGPGELAAALASAKREAASSFGDDTMLVEKLLTTPRHIEVQIFCDSHGNAVYLFERDCSSQRRHQKIIEEAPAPGLSEQQRQAMGEAAIRAAQAIDYRGAGTVEFLFDATSGAFYFMEMNTRLQVEHPVTEMITGQDLVAWQLRIAAGEPLPLRQQDLTCHGHAFEARIYAEDPDAGFLPATGKLHHVSTPPENRHVRIDTGVREGDAITPWYDPMIAKLIVWDQDRPAALRRLRHALREFRVAGVTTNIPFLYNLAVDGAFSAGGISTRYVEDNQQTLVRTEKGRDHRDRAAAGLYLVLDARRRGAQSSEGDRFSPWTTGDAWRITGPKPWYFDLQWHDQPLVLRVESLPTAGSLKGLPAAGAREGLPAVGARGGLLAAGARGGLSAAGARESLLVWAGDDTPETIEGYLKGNQLHVIVNGHRSVMEVADDGQTITIFSSQGAFHFTRTAMHWQQEEVHGGFKAPINGTIIQLLVQPGQPVAPGDPLLVLEAMKMEHTISAPEAGHVETFHCTPGDLVDAGQILLEFTPANDPASSNSVNDNSAKNDSINNNSVKKKSANKNADNGVKEPSA
jgi:3-methylcrotonyl-CoA carboxylase alpha subunit